MTLAPGPFGPVPAQLEGTKHADRADDPASNTAPAPDVPRSINETEAASSIAAADMDDTATDASGLDTRVVAAPRVFAPATTFYARPAFTPADSATEGTPDDASTPATAYESPANMDVQPADTVNGDNAEYLHPAEHLPEPEPDEHDWQRVDTTPQPPVVDYSVFRYVRPSRPAEPAIEPVDAPAPLPDAPDETPADDAVIDELVPVTSSLPDPEGEIAVAGMASQSWDYTPRDDLPLSLNREGERGDEVHSNRALTASQLETTAAPRTSPELLVLASMQGMGLVNVDGAGVCWPQNEAGATLLEALGSAYGGPAPTTVIEALSFARASGKPFLRDTPAPSPEARHISIVAIANDNGGGTIALRDHTEETLLQERLLQSEKMASVGQLVSGVAHELNNPLTGVMGFAQLLLARDLDYTVRGQIQTIYGEAERAAKIVQNLLSFARRRKPTKEMADINALLQRVLELRSYDFNIRNISLDMTMDSRMPAVWADPDQIQQVFFNVIKNAEQAMIDAHRGGKLSVTTAGTPDGVRISIADSGPGIPAEVQRRIFDPFFTTKEAGEGTGLGLTICYGIMEEHGGRIWTENLPGGGACFNLELPIGKPDEPDFNDRGVDDNNLLPAPSVSSRKVLVVDDEESIRLLLHDILRLDDHAVRVARSGLEAFELVRSEHFDVIITDMKMPGMDGASFYREVRLRDPALARRIVFITGDTVSPDTRAFLQRVSNPVLSKPFKIGPLRDAIETVLHQ